MSMNLVSILDDLKNLPNQVVMGYANGSNPEVPPYAALAELNRRKTMEQQYQNAAAKANQPSVKQQIEQAVVKPGQANPQEKPQGIAAALPQGAQPPQPVPATQSAGTPMRSGGIAKFAAGGKASANDQVSQLMDQILKSIIQAPPQAAQGVGVPAPQEGKAMPMQNYAAFQFGTRPQQRPATEAAPISQDLSFGQMGQYSSQQPIALANGGLMHHVPHHMYKFAPGGIIAFAEGDKVKKPVLTQAQLDQMAAQFQSNTGIIPGSSYADAMNRYKEAAPPQQFRAPAPTPNVTTIDPNNLNVDNTIPGMVAGDTYAKALAAATPAPASPRGPRGPLPRGQQAVEDQFTGIGNAISGFFSNNNPNSPRMRAANPAPVTPPATTAAAPTTPSGGGIGDLVNVSNNLTTPTTTTAPVAPTEPKETLPPNALTPAQFAAEIRARKDLSKEDQDMMINSYNNGYRQLKANTETKKEEVGIRKVLPTSTAKYPVPTHETNAVVEDVVKKAAMEALKKTNATEEMEEQLKIFKAMGINNDAGAAALKRAMEAHDEYKKADDSLERFQRIMSAIGRGGLVAGGEESARYSAEKRAADFAESRQHMEDLTKAEDKTREEKRAIAGNVLKSLEEKNKAAGTAAGTMYGHELTSKTQLQTERMRQEGEDSRARMRLAEEAKHRDLTAQEIAKLTPEEQEAYRKAQQIKSGASTKLDYQGINAILQAAIARNKAAQAGFDDAEKAAAQKDLEDAKRMMKNFHQGKDPYEGAEGASTQVTAPPKAIDYLKANPTAENKEFFRKKYGYLPEGV